MERMGVSRGDILQQIVLIHIECIQMVVGYLDIFVFEEFVLAFRPVVDGGDCVLQADPGIVVPDEIYRGQHFKCQGVRISVMTTGFRG